MTTARTSLPTSPEQHEPHPTAEHAWNRCTKCIDGFITEYRLVLTFPRSPGKPPIVLSGLVESEEEGECLVEGLRLGSESFSHDVKSGAKPCSCKPKKDDKLAATVVSERAAELRAADVVDRKSVSAGDRE